MKRKRIQDERVLSQKRKIGNDAFQILFYGLLISVLVQQYMFNASFSQYAVEIILFFIVSIYILVRNLMAGNDIFDSSMGGQKLVVINSLVCGLTVSIVNTTLNYIKFGEIFKTDIVNTILVSTITFLSASVTAFVVLQLVYILNKKKQMKIESKLQNDDI